MSVEVQSLGGRNVGVRHRPTKSADAKLPLIVAIHGGTYTSEYYDLDEFSLVSRAESLGFPILAIDRPGYGQTEALAPDELSHDGNSRVIEAIVADFWNAQPGSCPGVVLIGHSIGGAIAAAIAARRPAWPLLGVAMSGVGLHHAEGNSDDLRALGGGSHLSPPPEFKNSRMFGPKGSLAADVMERSRRADAPAPIQDIVDIVRTWPSAAASLLSEIVVPVHYRQAEWDAMWKVDAAEIEGFEKACTGAPWVDAGIMRHTGHCIDFHRVGAAFQLEQLAFAIKCVVQAELAS